MVDYYPESAKIGLNVLEVEAATSYFVNGPGLRMWDHKGLFLGARELYMILGRERGIERSKYQHEGAGDRLELPATREWVELLEGAFKHWRDKYPKADMATIGAENAPSPLYRHAELDVKMIDQSIEKIQTVAELVVEASEIG